jgi:putative FmdB family regulatory protein
MPIYEYQCIKCGAHLEVLQKMGEQALTRCEHCRGKLHKVVSRTSFQLKGDGWYVTDYGRPKNSDKEPKPKPDAKAGDSTATCTPAGCGACE